MTTYAYLSTYGNPDRVRYWIYNYYGAVSAAGAILVGATDPNIPFPVCGPKTLYTNAAVTIPAGSDRSGHGERGQKPLIKPSM